MPDDVSEIYDKYGIDGLMKIPGVGKGICNLYPFVEASKTDDLEKMIENIDIGGLSEASTEPFTLLLPLSIAIFNDSILDVCPAPIPTVVLFFANTSNRNIQAKRQL